MNAALNAVRFANSSAFADTPKMASKSAKRSLLRHLADLSRWSCEVNAYLEGHASPRCDHHACRWICFQSEVETADELSMSESAVKRTRRALVADGWITLTQGSMGRGAITFYTLDRVRLASVVKQKHEKQCKLPPSLRPPEPVADPKESNLLLFEADAADLKLHPLTNGSNLHPLPTPQKTEGEQPAPSQGAPCTDKGSNLPLLNRKNRKEPIGEPKTNTLLVLCPSDAEVERIYQTFPRRVGKPKALTAIRAAVKHLGSGKDWPAMTVSDAMSFLHKQVTLFANSPAGNADQFTPHPATWFNAHSYLDEEKEWQRGHNQGYQNGNSGQVSSNVNARTARNRSATAQAIENIGRRAVEEDCIMGGSDSRDYGN